MVQFKNTKLRFLHHLLTYLIFTNALSDKPAGTTTMKALSSIYCTQIVTYSYMGTVTKLLEEGDRFLPVEMEKIKNWILFTV